MIDLHRWPTPDRPKVTLFPKEARLDCRIVAIGAGGKFELAEPFAGAEPCPSLLS